MQFEDPDEDTKLDEDCKMEVDDEADSHEKLEVQDN